MTRAFAGPALALLGVLVTACTPSVKCDVVRFHQLTPPTGETIRIAPTDPAKRGSLEFDGYAQMIAQRLDRLGYRTVPGDSPSDLVARVDYAVGDGETVIKTWPHCSTRYHFVHRHYYDPYWYGYSCWGREVYTYTRYLRLLEVTIVRPAGPGGTDQVLFEGHVQSLGRNDRLTEVMPYLVTAMFTNFPGESGVTKTVTIERDGVEPAADADTVTSARDPWTCDHPPSGRSSPMPPWRAHLLFR